VLQKRLCIWTWHGTPWVARISNTGGLYTFTGSKLVTEFVALPLMPTSVDRWVKGSLGEGRTVDLDANLAD